MDLAARREDSHPEDSPVVYQERIEPLANQTNNKAYTAAYGLLLRVRELMHRLEYKRKRNFMKLLDGTE